MALKNALVSELNNYLQDMPLKRARYTSLSSAHTTFSRLDHIIGHKTSINKFKKTEIT